MKVTHHLTLRVAWHDSKWNGKIWKFPSQNSLCVMLDRVREEANTPDEDPTRTEAGRNDPAKTANRVKRERQIDVRPYSY